MFIYYVVVIVARYMQLDKTSVRILDCVYVRTNL